MDSVIDYNDIMLSSSTRKAWWLVTVVLVVGGLLFVIFGWPLFNKAGRAEKAATYSGPTAGSGKITAGATAATYLALGDSVAYGVGASPPEQKGYPAVLYHDYLQRSADRQTGYKNLAIPGETTDSFIKRNGGKSQLEQALAEIEAARQSGRPVSLITLTIGVNDVLAARSSSEAGKAATLADFDANFQKILKELANHSGGQAVIIVTTYYNPFPYQGGNQTSETDWVRRFNDTIRQRATELKLKVADFYEPVVGHEADFTWIANGDIHPNPAGHALLAAQVWQVAGLSGKFSPS